MKFTRRRIEAGSDAADRCTPPALLLGRPAQLPVPIPGNEPVDRTTTEAAMLREGKPVVPPPQDCCRFRVPMLALIRGPMAAPLNAGMPDAPEKEVIPKVAGLKLLLAVVAVLLKWRAINICSGRTARDQHTYLVA